jgi:hypothetical protein
MTEQRDDPSFDAWEEHVREELIPMLADAAVTISMVPQGGKTDIKFAVELGLSIMLDKPIIALVEPGTSIPNALARVADEIVEVDIRNDNAAAQKSIGEAFERVMLSRQGHVRLGEIDENRGLND